MKEVHKFLKKSKKNQYHLMSLGILTKIFIYFNAKRDAKRSLPKLENGMWQSPYFWAILKSHEKFVAETCVGFSEALQKVLTQMSLEFQEAREITKKLTIQKKLVEELKLNLTTRRSGEEHMDLEIVKARRFQEVIKLNSTLDALNKQHQTLIAKLISRLNLVKALSNMIRVNIDNSRELAKLKLNYYFDVVLRHHPLAEQIPCNQDYDAILTKPRGDYLNEDQKLLVHSVTEFVDSKEVA